MAIGENLLIIGIIALFLGIILTFAGGMISSSKSEKSSVKSAGIIFIGPIPVGWASDKKMFYTLIGLTILVFILWVAFSRIGR